MELHEALTQIGDIRRQMRRTRRFLGYGAATTLCTGVGAVAAAMWQARYLPDPSADPSLFVNLWIAVATASFIFVGTELAIRYRRSESSLQRELTILAVEQFLPSVAVGGLVTVVICQYARQSIWMLPGLWQVFFGSGLFASRRLLPSPIMFVGIFYVAAGLINLAASHNGASFSPWSMAVPFGIGQAATALVLSRKAAPDDAE
ncbi:MAG: hypothetical protein ABSH22_16005 [Tepidisphaeraceae bacterium]